LLVSAGDSQRYTRRVVMANSWNGEVATIRRSMLGMRVSLEGVGGEEP